MNKYGQKSKKLSGMRNEYVHPSGVPRYENNHKEEMVVNIKNVSKT